ncbi:MAG: S8 family serine peptidase [Verrucomicrobia bacterium]|nr:S8 family serine peptidase [Verrucomicrobiota bacterium]
MTQFQSFLSLACVWASLALNVADAAPNPNDAAGLNPARLITDASTRSASSAGQFVFRLEGAADAIYSIQASSELKDWTPVATYQTAASGRIHLLDPDAGKFDQRFYRAFVWAAPPNASVSIPVASDGSRLYPLLGPQVIAGLPIPRLGAEMHSSRILIKPKAGIALGLLSPIHLALSGQVLREFSNIGNLQVVQLSVGNDVNRTIQAYQASGLVEYAEPDYLVRVLAEPDDFRFKDGTLWNLHNVGQGDGVADADIDAPEAWDARTAAENIVVAVVDTGVRYTHEDLAPNMWVNSREIRGNGIDDDGNGVVDDIHGLNAIKNDGDPLDDHGHGSHVAGIIGAAGNNQLGVVGVAWKVQLMACKFINPQGDGAVSDAIACLDYARKNGAKIINGSWGGPAFNSQALREAIESARSAGIIFVAASGNSAKDNENPPDAVYPASFDLDNILSVMATTRRDEVAFFSNYGAKTVDLGAPGLDVFSCWTGSDSAYQFFLGTSMAAAHVSGSCALAWAAFPGEGYRQIINRVLAGADPVPSLAGRCVTGGRLNLQNVLSSAPRQTTISVVASDPQASEVGTATGAFTLTRTGSTASALTVKFTLGGPAVNGTDYQRLESSIIIPAGEISATLTVTPIDDAEREDIEAVILTLASDAAYAVGSPNNATVTIEDNDGAPTLPVVTVVATDEKAAEAGPDAGEFTISRTGDTAAAMAVQFALEGTAVNGTDYKTLATSVTMAAGAASAVVKVEPVDDTAVESGETVVLTLKEDAAYKVGTSNSATVAIEDNDAAPTLPVVTVVATDEKAAEAGPDAGEFTISRTGDTAAALTVQFTLEGTAVNGTDYKTLATSATMAAGAGSAVVKVEPVDDTAAEAGETVILTLKEDAAYKVGTPNSAAVAIEDNDAAPTLPVVTVVATDDKSAEAGPDAGEFTISRTGDAAAALTVQFTLSGTAGNGTDYKALASSATLAAGAASTTIKLEPVDDTAVEDNETVILTLTEDATYKVGTPNSATVAIEDNDAPPALPVVTVIATDDKAAEAGPDSGEFTISRSGDTAASLVVKYALGGTAVNSADYRALETSVTIPSGASSTAIRITPIDDTAVEGNETVILSLAENEDYVIGDPRTANVTIEDNDQTTVVADFSANPSEGTVSLRVEFTDKSTGPVVSWDWDFGDGSPRSTERNPTHTYTTPGEFIVTLTVTGQTITFGGKGPVSRKSKTIRVRPATPLPIVSITASVTLLSEGASAGAQFSIGRTGDTTASLTVRLALGGTATNGTDYNLLPETLTIPAGSSSANLTMIPIDDHAIELPEAVIVTVKPDSAYVVGSLNIGIIVISDNDPDLGLLNLESKD